MAQRKARRRAWLALAVIASGIVGLPPVLAVEASAAASSDVPLIRGKTFTVADEIGIALFGDPSHSGMVREITWSPTGRMVVVHASRGLLKENRVEAELRVYSGDQLRKFVRRTSASGDALPLWTIKEATYKEGPIVSDIRWTRKGDAFAFLLKSKNGNYQLALADVARRKIKILTPAEQDVLGFDLLDEYHYVYAARDTAVWDSKPLWETDASYMTASGRPLGELLLPQLFPKEWTDRGFLWAAVDGHPKLLKNPSTGAPIVLYSEGDQALSISPTGGQVLTALPVELVPSNWQKRFAIPADWHLPIIAGPQNTKALLGSRYISRYARVDLRRGTVVYPTDNPVGASRGWLTDSGPAWSEDGKEVLLPSVFEPDKTVSTPFRPCVAVYDLSAATIHCLERIKNRYTENGPEPGFYRLTKSYFVGTKGQSVALDYDTLSTETPSVTGRHIYSLSADGIWVPGREGAASPDQAKESVTLQIKQGLNQAPTLVVTDPENHASATAWDPNPQLREFAFQDAIVFHWKDSGAHERIGGLYLPVGYRTGKRYPLVIQPHGFAQNVYAPSGIFPTALAARALASAGIAVLQVQDCYYTVDKTEGPCQVSSYEAAVRKLAKNGIIDPERVGISGFSRTVYFTLEALTSSDINFAAASITDGVSEGYWQYVNAADFVSNGISNEADRLIGARPFGKGLQVWLRNSPLFNMNRVHTPVKVVAEGPFSLLMFMWEPYAVLHDLGKPVELGLLNTDEHVLTNPGVRLASQGGSVDWFRFWLQGYEDPNPTKTLQYRCWERLCEMQVAQNPGRRTFCVQSAPCLRQLKKCTAGP